MKKILIVMLLCFVNLGFSQGKIAQQVSKLQTSNVDFKKVTLLNKDVSIPSDEVKKIVNDATLAKLNPYKLQELVSSNPEFIELEIPYLNESVHVLLYQVNLFTEDFKINTDKQNNVSYQKGKYYRGIVKGDSNSVAGLSFFNNEFNGIISSEKLGNLVIGKLNEKGNTSNYIIYSDANMNVSHDWTCNTVDEAVELDQASVLQRNVATSKCVTFYFEVDYTIYTSNDSDVTSTTNWMTSVYNNVQTLFDNDEITTALKELFIWTTPDIYQGIGTSSGIYLTAFGENRPVFNGDVGMLVGIDPGGLGGVAYLNSICGDLNYSYSDVNYAYSTVPTYSWTVSVITHEFGHSLGSPHTHGCYWNGNSTSIDGCGAQAGYREGNCDIGPIPSSTEKGTIMSYCHLLSGVGINFNNGFGIQPRNLIQNRVNSKICLSSNCAESCSNTVTSIVITDVSNTSLQVTWDDLNEDITQWEVNITTIGSFGIWNTVNEKTYLANGLQPNTYYFVNIRPICPSSTPVTRTTYHLTKANYCNGIVFTDTGGTTNNHGNLENFTRTMIPNIQNQKIVANFTSFSLENNYDYLYIYNGSDDTYPEFNDGDGFTGTNSPGTITSTAADGSLTFKFISDMYETASGWIATINCENNLSTISQNFIDFSYYPNPTNSTVKLNSNTVMSLVKVYNLQGVQLLNQSLNTTNSTIDLSQFATGTYFFKVTIEDKDLNFKVVKL
jgi:hypothetical protein